MHIHDLWYFLCKKYSFTSFLRLLWAREHTRTHSDLAELDLGRYGLSESDKQNFHGILNTQQSAGSLAEAKDFLHQAYCGDTSIEFAYIESEREREWLAENYEKSIVVSQKKISDNSKREILELLLKSQAWDHFLAAKFPSVKRYGGEGAESMMAFFWQLLRSSAAHDVSDIVLGMPHRGKLNLMTTMLQTRPVRIFRKFKGLPEFPDDVKAMGDIPSHFREFHMPIATR